jgi:4,5-epoxidase
VATRVLAGTGAMTGVMLGRTAVPRFVRDHVVVPLMDRPIAQRPITDRSAQLSIAFGTPARVTVAA